MRTASKRCSRSPGESPGSVRPSVSDCLKSRATPPEGRPEGSTAADPKIARQPRLSHHSCASPQASLDVRWCSWSIKTWASANSDGSPSTCHLALKGCQELTLSVMRPKRPLRGLRAAGSRRCSGGACVALLMGWGGVSRERAAPPLVGRRRLGGLLLYQREAVHAVGQSVPADDGLLSCAELRRFVLHGLVCPSDASFVRG